MHVRWHWLLCRKSDETNKPSIMLPCKAYVQGDWNAASVVSGEEAAKEQYRAMLRTLEEAGVTNTATWHEKAVGVEPCVRAKDEDVIRNCEQVLQADCVITVCRREDPPYKHWGSIATMAFAVGAGRPCYLVCSDTNVIVKNYFINHPRVARFNSVEGMLEHMRSK
jgi:hypothetical protein